MDGGIRIGVSEIAPFRAHIQILDRQKLETVECYQVVRDEFERLLG